MLPTSTLLLVTLALQAHLIAPQSQCPTPTHLAPVTPVEKFQRAQIVLYGKDTSPMEPCTGATSGCGRRQITFQVLCVLKGISYHIGDTITIGARKTIDPCDGTFFAYNDRGSSLFVFVKFENGVFDWDESAPLQPAKMTYTEKSLSYAHSACGVVHWVPPYGQTTDTCPKRPQMTSHCKLECPPKWKLMGESCFYISLEAKTYSDSDKACTDGDSSLAIFPTEELWMEMADTLPTTGKWWSQGFFKQDNDSITGWWADKNGRSVNMDYQANWLPGDPLIDGHVLVGKDGWSKQKRLTVTMLPYICQKDPGPLFPLLPTITEKMEVEFEVIPRAGTACCRYFTYSAGEFELEEDGLTALANAVTHAPECLQADWGEQDNSGKYYTAIMVDISGTKMSLGTRTEPYVHWLSVNMQLRDDGSIFPIDGATVIPYLSPEPETTSQGPYVVYVYLQEELLLQKFREQGEGRIGAFSDETCRDRPRCHFHLQAFASKWGLTEIGGLSFNVNKDGYLAKKQIEENWADPLTTCRHVWDDTMELNGNLVCGFVPESASNGRDLMNRIDLILILCVMSLFLVHNYF